MDRRAFLWTIAAAALATVAVPALGAARRKGTGGVITAKHPVARYVLPYADGKPIYFARSVDCNRMVADAIDRTRSTCLGESDSGATFVHPVQWADVPFDELRVRHDAPPAVAAEVERIMGAKPRTYGEG